MPALFVCEYGACYTATSATPASLTSHVALAPRDGPKMWKRKCIIMLRALGHEAVPTD